MTVKLARDIITIILNISIVVALVVLGYKFIKLEQSRKELKTLQSQLNFEYHRMNDMDILTRCQWSDEFRWVDGRIINCKEFFKHVKNCKLEGI